MGKMVKFYMGRGLTYSMCEQVNLGELPSTWLVNICLTNVQRDTPSLSAIFFFWGGEGGGDQRLANQLYHILWITKVKKIK